MRRRRGTAYFAAVDHGRISIGRSAPGRLSLRYLKYRPSDRGRRRSGGFLVVSFPRAHHFCPVFFGGDHLPPPLSFSPPPPPSLFFSLSSLSHPTAWD